MLRHILGLFGYVPAVANVAKVPQTIQEGRPLSDVEAMARIRHLLNDPRFKFRKLGTITKAIGRDIGEAYALVDSMPDVLGSRDNGQRPWIDRLFTFDLSAPVIIEEDD